MRTTCRYIHAQSFLYCQWLVFYNEMQYKMQQRMKVVIITIRMYTCCYVILPEFKLLDLWPRCVDYCPSSWTPVTFSPRTVVGTLELQWPDTTLTSIKTRHLIWTNHLTVCYDVIIAVCVVVIGESPRDTESYNNLK